MSETIRRWTWLGLIAVAAAMHFSLLNSVPLSPGETAQALASLDTVNGAALSTPSHSELLLLGNTVLFSVFGAGNGMARLIPALAGLGLVLLPLYWQRRLGHAGALAAAGVLLISPLILFASRRVEGTIPGLLAVGCLFTALTPVWDKQRSESQRTILIVLGVSTGLLSGPVFYDLFISGSLAWLLWHWIQRERVDWRKYQFVVRPGLIGFGVALLVSIGFGSRWNGWNGLMSGFSDWLSTWTAASDVSHLGALLLYEPLTLILAALGVGYAWRERTSFPLALAFWALLDLLIVSLRGGAPVTGTAASIFALAYCAGYGVENLAKGMPVNLSRWILLHSVLGFVLLIPALLGLTQYAGGLISAEQPVLVLMGFIVLLALQALLAFLFSLVLPLNVLWRSAFLGIALMSLYIQTGFSLQLNFIRPTSALEPAVMRAGSPDMAAFRTMVSDMAVQLREREDSLVLTVVDTDSEITDSVRWTLRDYNRVRVSSTWPTEAELSATQMLVITPESMDLSAVAVPGWKGMRFTVIQSDLAPTPGCRRSTTVDCTDWVKWYLYRTSPSPQSLKGLILWANR